MKPTWTGQTFGSHVGLTPNNFNSILQLGNDSNYVQDDQLSFKLSHYHANQTTSIFCFQNKNGLNLMSLNAQYVFKNVEMIRKEFDFLSIKHKYK